MALYVEPPPTGSIQRLFAGHGYDPAYRHWDKLRHLDPPDGLTHEDWWTSIKFARQHVLRPRRVPERLAVGGRERQYMRTEIGAELTSAAVLELQRILTDGTLDDPSAAGRLQTSDDVRVDIIDAQDGSIVHRPPSADELPARLEALCAFANAREERDVFIHPVVRAILLHFMLAYDHPFEEGNGRTARALFYWSMRVQGYWLTEYLSISRILRGAPAQYDRAFLLTETDGGDTTYFLIHQLGVILRAIEELHAYLEKKTAEIRSVEQLLRRSARFNHRQLALLGNALRNPGTAYTFASHAASHDVTQETARSDLGDLVSRGFLAREKSGRKYVFVARPDLAKRLKRAR